MLHYKPSVDLLIELVPYLEGIVILFNASNLENKFLKEMKGYNTIYKVRTAHCRSSFLCEWTEIEG